MSEPGLDEVMDLITDQLRLLALDDPELAATCASRAAIAIARHLRRETRRLNNETSAIRAQVERHIAHLAVRH